MTAPIAGFTPTTPPAGSASTGLNSMTASDFLNLMIQQLQQQDPLNPTDSNQLLTQMSQISTLQSNTQMEQSLSGLTLQQSIGAGGNLIGKTVKGISSVGQEVQGVVTSVAVKDKNVFLELDSSDEVPLANVENITSAGPVNAAALASALQSAADNSGGTNNNAIASLLSLLSSLGGVAA